MNDKINVTIFVLALVKLEEYALQLGYEDFQIFSASMLDVMNLVDREYLVPFDLLAKIRSVPPFINFSLDQERFIYSVFGNLK